MKRIEKLKSEIRFIEQRYDGMFPVAVHIRIYGTAYVKANSPEEALEIMKKLADETMEVELLRGSARISGLPFDHPNLPEVSLSPAMIIHGLDDETLPEEP